MKSVYLRTLVEVINSGSITKASDILCVTQPAVSRRIKFIEEQYGCPLIDRSGQKLLLTPTGKLVYKKAVKMLEIERELLSNLKSMREKKCISFICTPTFGMVHLPTIMREFMLEYAELADLSFMFDSPGAIVKGMRDGMYDLAVIEHVESFDLTELPTVALPGDDMIFVSSPLLGLTDKLSLSELLTQTILARKDGCSSRTLLEDNLRSLGRDFHEFRSVVVVDDLNIILQAAQDGQGISFLSRELVQEQIQSGLLCEHRIEGFCHSRYRTLVIPDICQQIESPRSYFIDRIHACFGVTPKVK